MEQDLEKYFLDWAKGLVGDAENIEKMPHGEEGTVFRMETSTGQ